MKLINKLNARLAKRQKGFSLVELLVVIAVIGILAAVAIPALSNVFESSEQSKNKRNAQNIASMYASARASGATFTGTTPAAIAAELASGTKKGSGTFSNTVFSVNLDGSEINAATAYLTYNPTTKMLTYTGTQQSGANN